MIYIQIFMSVNLNINTAGLVDFLNVHFLYFHYVFFMPQRRIVSFSSETSLLLSFPPYTICYILNTLKITDEICRANASFIVFIQSVPK